MNRERETLKGAHVEVVCMGENVPPLEENTDLSEFNLERAQLLLRLFYGDYLHQNNGSHLDGGVADDAI